MIEDFSSPAEPARRSGSVFSYVSAATVLLVAGVVADIDEGLSLVTLIVFGLGRAAIMLAVAGFVRLLYVERHGGSVHSPETVWIAALFAVLLAAGRLTA